MSAKRSPLFWRLFFPPIPAMSKNIYSTHIPSHHCCHFFPHYFPFILASLFSSFCLPSRCLWTCQIYTNGKLSSYSPASFFHKKRQSFPSQAFWGIEEKLAWGESSLLLKFYHADVQVRIMLSNKPAHISLRQAKSLGRNGGWQLLSCRYLNCHNF